MYILTPREMEVAKLVAKGLPNKEIARRLNVEDGTVKVRVRTIFIKTGASNRTSLAVMMTTPDWNKPLGVEDAAR
jgi:DNA-binding NarL/FixJ family response regulator